MEMNVVSHVILYLAIVVLSLCGTVDIPCFIALIWSLSFVAILDVIIGLCVSRSRQFKTLMTDEMHR